MARVAVSGRIAAANRAAVANRAATANRVPQKYILPSLTSGLVLWLEADVDYTTVSSKVSAWADYNVGGIVVKQNTAANQPPYNTNPLNGHPTLNFDGNATWLQAATNIPALKPSLITVICVNRLTTAPAVISYCVAQGDTGNSGYYLGYDPTKKQRIKVGRGADNGVVLGTVIETLNVWTSAAFTFDGTTINAYRNNVANGTFTFGSTVNLAYTTITFTVGNNESLIASRTLLGDIALILIYNRALSGAELTALHTSYISPKYGL